jgi:hypothetical protein
MLEIPYRTEFRTWPLNALETCLRAALFLFLKIGEVDRETRQHRISMQLRPAITFVRQCWPQL